MVMLPSGKLSTPTRTPIGKSNKNSAETSGFGALEPASENHGLNPQIFHRVHQRNEDMHCKVNSFKRFGDIKSVFPRIWLVVLPLSSFPIFLK